MSRWGRWERYAPAAKKPPPADGIKVKKAGTTWWGQQWIEALEDVLRGDAGRLARGRTYARAGRTHDLVVKGGKVTAKVTGSRPTPYKIEIQLAQLDAAAWRAVIARVAEKAQFSAELLSGQMPKEIGEAFRAAGTSLFPREREDLVTDCSCPDWGDPCKHVAATHYVLGEALDRDPFLLFELRGRTKDQVLDALRAARGGEPEASPASPSRKRAGKAGAASAPAAAVAASAPAIPTVALGAVTAADYDRPREALPSLRFSFDEPVTHGAVLRQLGAPAAWAGDSSPADLLAPLVRAAAEAARRIAMAEPRDLEADADAAGSGESKARRANPAPAGTRARKAAAKRQAK